MDAEKEIIRDIWLYLKEHRDQPAPDSETCLSYWQQAAEDIGNLVGDKWSNHPLAMELGIAVYSYLETRFRGKGGGA